MKILILPGAPTPLVRIYENSNAGRYIEARPDELSELKTGIEGAQEELQTARIRLELSRKLAAEERERYVRERK